MYKQVQTLRTFARMAWLYRWAGLALAICVCVGGWVAVLLLPNQYEVGAKVFLDSRSMLRPLLRGIAFETSFLSDASLLLSKQLLTRPNLEEVARKVDLDLRARTPEEFDAIIQNLASRIKITRASREESMYDIVYADPSPKVAKAVVDELLNTFMEASLGDTRRETVVTQKFLDEQIASYEQRLIEAEERLKEFKRRNVGVMPGSQGGYFERLSAAHAELNQAQLDLKEAVNRRDQLRAQAAGGAEITEDIFASEQFVDELSSPEILYFDSKIQELTSRIDELLVNYTEKHPDIVGMRKTIASLEERREVKMTELAEQALENPMEPGAPVVNPLVQQLRLQAAEADAVVASLQTRVTEYERRVKELELKVDSVPEVEAELARLDRDYSINRSQYQELLKRREQAQMAQAADQTEDDVKIKIIEPPRLPLLPTGPNRLLYATIVLLLGLGAGGALAVVLSQLSPRIIDVPDLKAITGLPVLTVITMASNALHRRQRRLELLAFAGALLGIVAVFTAQVALQVIGIDLHDKLQSVVGALT